NRAEHEGGQSARETFFTCTRNRNEDYDRRTIALHIYNRSTASVNRNTGSGEHERQGIGAAESNHVKMAQAGIRCVINGDGIIAGTVGVYRRSVDHRT